MEAINVKTIEDSQRYCEGVLNDFEAGIITKADAMDCLWEYTVQLHNLFAINVEKRVQERISELYEKGGKECKS